MIVLPNKDNSIIDIILGGENGWTVQQIGRRLQFTSSITGKSNYFFVPDSWVSRWGWDVRPDGIGVTLWNEIVHRPIAHDDVFRAKHSEYLARLTASEYAEEQAAQYYA